MSRPLALLCAADLLVALDSMIVVVALPAIGADLEMGPAELHWVVVAYTLPLGAFLLVGGRAGDLYGRRRILIAGLALFAAGSLAAGLSGGPLALLAARAAQGLGAALAVPSALALLVAAFEDEDQRRRALRRLSAVIDAGMVAGLVLGGILTASAGWPWVFLVVVPFSVAAAALAPRLLAQSRDEQAPSRLDLPGAVLAVAAAALLVFGLTRAEHDGLGAPTAGGPLAAGVLLLAAFVAASGAARRR